MTSGYLDEEMQSVGSLQEKLAADAEKLPGKRSLSSVVRVRAYPSRITGPRDPHQQYVYAEPEFDDPNFDPDVVFLGEWTLFQVGGREVLKMRAGRR